MSIVEEKERSGHHVSDPTLFSRFSCLVGILERLRLLRTVEVLATSSGQDLNSSISVQTREAMLK